MKASSILILIGLIEISLYYALAYGMRIATQRKLYRHNSITNPFIFCGSLANIYWYTIFLHQNDMSCAVLHIILAVALGLIPVIQLIFSTCSKKAIISESILFGLFLAATILICVFVRKTSYEPLFILGIIFQCIFTFHGIIKGGLIATKISNEPFPWWEMIVASVGSILISIGGYYQTINVLYTLSWIIFTAGSLYAAVLLGIHFIASRNVIKNHRPSATEIKSQPVSNLPISTNEIIIKDDNANAQNHEVESNEIVEGANKEPLEQSEGNISYESNNLQVFSIHKEKSISKRANAAI